MFCFWVDGRVLLRYSCVWCAGRVVGGGCLAVRVYVFVVCFRSWVVVFRVSVLLWFVFALLWHVCLLVCFFWYVLLCFCFCMPGLVLFLLFVVRVV